MNKEGEVCANRHHWRSRSSSLAATAFVPPEPLVAREAVVVPYAGVGALGSEVRPEGVPVPVGEAKMKRRVALVLWGDGGGEAVCVCVCVCVGRRDEAEQEGREENREKRAESCTLDRVGLGALRGCCAAVVVISGCR